MAACLDGRKICASQDPSTGYLISNDISVCGDRKQSRRGESSYLARGMTSPFELQNGKILTTIKRCQFSAPQARNRRIRNFLVSLGIDTFFQSAQNVMKIVVAQQAWLAKVFCDTRENGLRITLSILWPLNFLPARKRTIVFRTLCRLVIGGKFPDRDVYQIVVYLFVRTIDTVDPTKALYEVFQV